MRVMQYGFIVAVIFLWADYHTLRFSHLHYPHKYSMSYIMTKQ